jgi:hypothetical protein
VFHFLLHPNTDIGIGRWGDAFEAEPLKGRDAFKAEPLKWDRATEKKNGEGNREILIF